MSNTISRQIRLKNRIVGMPKDSDFELVEAPLPEPAAGEVLVENLYTSVDPYMRGGMRSAELGKPLEGRCAGSDRGIQQCPVPSWRLCNGYAGVARPLCRVGRECNCCGSDDRPAPIVFRCGWYARTHRLLWISGDRSTQSRGNRFRFPAAAGAVGSIVCQIAKIKGCRVVASAGSDQKVAWLLETAGVDAAFNYKNVDDLEAELRKHCPDGLDIYFENVGGRHLQAALAVMNMHGRIPLCGMISQYNAIEPTPGPTNLSSAIGKRIRLQGFIVTDFMARNAEFYEDMRQWIGEGKIQWEETIIAGLENAPKAFIALFTGEKLGKIVVQV